MSSSTYTPNLGIEQPATGAYPNTWGNVANRSYAVLDAAIGGVGTITLTGTTYHLTTTAATDPSTALYPMLAWMGAPGATVTVTIAPNTQQRLYVMSNRTSDASAITFAQGGGASFTLQSGHDAQICCDGFGANANVAATLNNPQFNNVLVTGALTIQGSLTGNLNLGNINAATLGLGGPSSVPDALTINGLGSAQQAQIRLVEGANANYGVLLRNDGSTFYLMATAANNPYGGWVKTPFIMDLASGSVGVGGAGPNATYGLTASSLHCSSVLVDTTVSCANLSAFGSIVVDALNTNTGGIDVAFGSGLTEGIGSARSGGGAANQGGLTFFTANTARVVVLNNGQVAINMFPVDGSALTVSGAIRTTGGIVFPDGSVQTTAVSGTLTSLQVNGNANITGTLSVGGNVSVTNGDMNLAAGHVYRINNVPLSTGISGVTVYVGPPLWTEPGISFSAGVGMSIVASHNSPGNYGTLTFNNTVSSDERVKRNVRPLQGGLSILSQLHPIEGEYNGLGGTREGERVVGVMAQELQRLLPGCVMSVRGKLRKDDAEETDLLYVNTQELIYQMLLAIQQLYGRSELAYGRHA